MPLLMCFQFMKKREDQCRALARWVDTQLTCTGSRHDWYLCYCLVAFLHSLLLQHAAVQSVCGPIAVIAIGRTQGGKPFFPGQTPPACPNWNFNVSHEVRCQQGLLEPYKLPESHV